MPRKTAQPVLEDVQWTNPVTLTEGNADLVNIQNRLDNVENSLSELPRIRRIGELTLGEEVGSEDTD